MASPHLDVLRVSPGIGISKIACLDECLSDVIKDIQNFSTSLPEVRFINDTKTYKFYIHLPTWGVSMVFQEVFQYLELISVDVSECQIPIFLGKTNVREIEDLRREFRDTATRKIVENAIIEGYEGISLVTDTGTLAKILIHHGKDYGQIPNLYKDKLYSFDLFPGSHLLVHPPKQAAVLSLSFSACPEEVMDCFGLPSKVFYSDSVPFSSSADYVYNYFHLGLDFVFDGWRNAVKEIRARNNLPEDQFFNVYQRCQFRLVLGEGRFLTCMSRLEDVLKVLGPEVQCGVKASSQGFDPVKYYMLRNVLVEVLECGRITSVAIRSDFG